MSSSGGGSRVSLPDNVRKMIDNINEITGKEHTDEDVYAMLKECAMDPNETAQKLLYLDTFHEVKSKRERRKEISNSKVPDSKMPSDSQGRGARGNRNLSSSHGSGGAKSLPAQREKRANNFIERVSGPTFVSQQKTKDGAAPHATKSSAVAANGPSSLSNGVPGPAQTPDFPVEDVGNVLEASASGVSSSSDPVLAPSLPRQSGAGPVKREIGLKRLPSGNSVYKKKVLNKSEAVEKDQAPQPLVSSSTFTEDGPGIINQSSEKNEVSVKEASVPLEVITSKVASVRVEANSQPLPTSTVYDSQHVTFPNHFQVSEAFKNGLTFGSFDVSFSATTEIVNGPVADDKTNIVSESSQGSDETADDSPPSNQAGDLADQPQPSSTVHEEVPPPSEDKPLRSADFTHEDPKQETLLPPEGPQNPVVQDVPSNSFGFISPILAGATMQTEGSEPQARDLSRPSYFINGTGPAISSPSPTPTAQNSMAVPAQPIPVFRQPYPLNFIQYGPPYVTPIYMPQIHQLLSHNAFAQQPSAGNLYLPPTMAAPGVKLPFPMFKPGNNATPIGIPSGYGAYGSTSMAYTGSPAVTSGTSANNEDLAASQLKENHIYSTAQLSDGPAVWIPPLGQDLTSLQVNSLYNLPQGQQITFSPAQGSHGAFGMQQPPQTMAGAPSVHPLLQQSQAGAVETVGLPSGGTYQLPQHAQVNWNTNF